MSFVLHHSLREAAGNKTGIAKSLSSGPGPVTRSTGRDLYWWATAGNQRVSTTTGRHRRIGSLPLDADDRRQSIGPIDARALPHQPDSK